MPLSSTITYLLGTSQNEEALNSGPQEANTLNTLEHIHDARDLGLFSPTLLQQKLQDDTFCTLMLTMQKNFQYVDESGREAPIRGTRNAQVASKLHDLRQVVMGREVMSRITANKSSDICRSEILKLIRDAIAKDGLDFKSVIREDSAKKLGYTLKAGRQKTKVAEEAVSTYQTLDDTVTTDPAKKSTGDIDDLKTWLSGQFKNTNGRIESVQTQINKISADTKQANDKADKVEKAVDTLTKELKVTTTKAETTDAKVTALDSDLKNALKKVKDIAEDPLQQLELEYRLKLRAHRARRQDDLQRGLIKIVVKNTNRFAALDANSRSNNSYKPLVSEILKNLNIEEKTCPLHQVRHGKAYPAGAERANVPLPFILIEANHGVIDDSRDSSKTTDHATYILTNLRTKNDDLLVSRATNSTDQMSNIFFTRWKQSGILERFMVNKHGLITLYFKNDEYIIVRLPLMLCTLSDPTYERVKEANQPGWCVYKGEPKKLFDERNYTT